MAERPMAPAPEGSRAALSPRVTFRPRPFAQAAASTAAPVQAMPPPTSSRSVSMVSTAGLEQKDHLQNSLSRAISKTSLNFRCCAGLLGPGRAGEETVFLKIRHIAGHGFALETVDG